MSNEEIAALKTRIEDLHSLCADILACLSVVTSARPWTIEANGGPPREIYAEFIEEIAGFSSPTAETKRQRRILTKIAADVRERPRKASRNN